MARLWVIQLVVEAHDEMPPSALLDEASQGIEGLATVRVVSAKVEVADEDEGEDV